MSKRSLQRNKTWSTPVYRFDILRAWGLNATTSLSALLTTFASVCCPFMTGGCSLSIQLGGLSEQCRQIAGNRSYFDQRTENRVWPPSHRATQILQ